MVLRKGPFDSSQATVELVGCVFYMFLVFYSFVPFAQRGAKAKMVLVLCSLRRMAYRSAYEAHFGTRFNHAPFAGSAVTIRTASSIGLVHYLVQCSGYSYKGHFLFLRSRAMAGSQRTEETLSGPQFCQQFMLFTASSDGAETIHQFLM